MCACVCACVCVCVAVGSGRGTACGRQWQWQFEIYAQVAVQLTNKHINQFIGHLGGWAVGEYLHVHLCVFYVFALMYIYRYTYIYIYICMYRYDFGRRCNSVYNSRAQLLRFVWTRTTGRQSCIVHQTALIWLLPTRWRSIKFSTIFPAQKSNHQPLRIFRLKGVQRLDYGHSPTLSTFLAWPMSAVGYLQFAFDLFHQLSLNFIKF